MKWQQHVAGAVGSVLGAMVSVMAASPAHADTVVTFQNGDANGYNSALNRGINSVENSPTGQGTTNATSLGVDGYQPTIVDPDPAVAQDYSPDRQLLLRFDNIFGNGPNQIPTGAFIIDASLQLSSHSATNSQSPGPIGIAGLHQAFTSSTVYENFDTSGGADNTAFGGNRGAWFENGQSERPLAGYGRVGRASTTNGGAFDPATTYTARITPLVRAWQSGSLPNNGMALQMGFAGSPDAWTVRANGYSDPLARPKLSVTYTTDPATSSTFRQGDAGYTGTTMAFVQHDPTAGDVTTDGAFHGEEFLDHGTNPATSADSAVTIKFDHLFQSDGGPIPSYATIHRAFVVITSADSAFSGNTRSPGAFEIDQLKNAWTTSTPYPNFGANGPGSDPADIQRDTQGGMITDSQVLFEVTSSIVDFQNGVVNNGWAIRGITTDGWGINMLASDPSTIPYLMVDWSVPEPSSLGLIGFGAIALLRRRRRCSAPTPVLM
jgi:hypothetical protein